MGYPCFQPAHTKVQVASGVRCPYLWNACRRHSPEQQHLTAILCLTLQDLA
jgi:hypothetical protein